MQPQTIEYLIDDAYTHWNNAGHVARIGIELESRTRLDIARKFLRRALYLDPTGNPEWYSYLAFACFRDVKKMDEEGELALTEGIEKTNSDYLKANYSAFMEEEQAAEDMIEQTRSSKDPAVGFAVGFALNWRGRMDEAMEQFRSVVAKLADDEFPMGLEDYVFGLTWAKAQGHDIDLDDYALPTINRLIAHDPLRYQYRTIKIQTLQVLQRWEEVMEACRETLLIMPDEETTMLARGIALEKLGNADEALLWYSRAIGSKPSFARARLNISKILEKKGEIDKAEEYLREIPVAFPEYTFGNIFLSFFQQRNNKLDAALQSFENSYALLKNHEKPMVARYPEGKELLKRAGIQ